MASWVDADVPGGYRAAGLSDGAGPWLIIHVAALERSDEELGQIARACADAAFYAEARSCADYFVITNRNRKPWMVDKEILDHEGLLRQFAGRCQLIDDALGIIDQVRTYHEHKAAKPQKRQEIRDNYNRLFVQIGRRGGFRCAHCGSSDDLAIDHVVALAVGGTNDLSNLQLLCGPCNSRKGA
jgi:HNH endonuclease